MLHIRKPAAYGARPASVSVNWQVGGAEGNASQVLRQAIRAELTGSDQASALGITARSPSPIIGLCRKLIAAGNNPATPLEAFRAGTLAIRIRSIGEAAGLEINGRGSGFRHAPGGGRRPVARNSGRGRP